jgi:predicted AlkP superfamily pyrophosphatase or phosphodiesterase
VSQMTSMFPSTTSAHSTTIHTGMDVNTSGVYEWYYYEPLIGEVITPLVFSLTHRMAYDELVTRGIQPADVFLPQTFYARLAESGIQSFVSQPRSINKSAYSQFVTRGAKHLPFLTLPEVLTNVTEHHERTNGKRYYMIYFSPIDTICHEYGPASAQTEAEVESMLLQMESFLRRCAKRFKKTLMLITADHGQVETSPENAFYLNQHFEGLERYFKKAVTGEPIYFGGSARDMFLYVEDQHLAEVESLLKPKLEGIAEVYTTQTLIDQGFFGASPISQRLADRIGNLVILPYKGESVYWYIKDRFEQPLRGHHGGLTPDEMLIPFIAYASG